MGGNLNDEWAGPSVKPMPWAARAVCRRADPALFFAPEGQTEDSSLFDTAPAKRLCGVCPVIVECLRWAVDNRQPVGIWGGTTPNERDRFLTRRAARRGRKRA